MSHVDELKIQIRRIEAEVEWHSEVPVTDPLQPLVFINNPLSINQYSRPSVDEFLQPNCGVHALEPGSTVNTPFLRTEYRLYELASLVQTMIHLDETASLLQCIYKELTCLHYQKEMNWLQQRAHLEPQRIVINTGKTYGLFQHHCRVLFGIDLNHRGGDGSRPYLAPKEKKVVDNKALIQCREIIKSGESNMLSELLKVHHQTLYLICVELDIRGEGNKVIIGTKWVLVRNIVLWVSTLSPYFLPETDG